MLLSRKPRGTAFVKFGKMEFSNFPLNFQTMFTDNTTVVTVTKVLKNRLAHIEPNVLKFPSAERLGSLK